MVKPQDCPFKPGTQEHKEWIKENVISYQHKDEVTYFIAKTKADYRLAKLKQSFKHTPLDDPIIEYLVNGGEEPPDPRETLVREKLKARVNLINTIWQQTYGGYIPIDMITAYMPQIEFMPEWITNETAYEVLCVASRRDIKEIERQQGYLFFAVHKSLSLQLNSYDDIISSSFSQVLVKYHKRMR